MSLVLSGAEPVQDNPVHSLSSGFTSVSYCLAQIQPRSNLRMMQNEGVEANVQAARTRTVKRAREIKAEGAPGSEGTLDPRKSKALQSGGSLLDW